MATRAVLDLGNKLKRVVSSFDTIAKRAIERHTQDIEDLQVHQMEQGKNAEGKDIGVLRNPAYAVLKKRKGGVAPLGMVDLKDTGAFHRSVNARVIHKAIHIDATDPKKADLEEKYGEEIIGFNEDTLSLLREKILPTVIFESRRKIQSR